MFWARMMLVASAALWQDQPSPVLDRLLLLTLRERGFSCGPLLVMDSAAAPGLLTSLLRVLPFPVLLLRTPFPRVVTAAMVAEPLRGSIVILRDELAISSTLQTFLNTFQNWPRRWSLRTTLLVILVSRDRRRQDPEVSLQQTLHKNHILDASVLVLDDLEPVFQQISKNATLYNWLRNQPYTNCTRASGRLTAVGHWDLRDSPVIEFPTVVLPRKIPKPEEGCPLTALVHPYVPLAMIKKNEDGKEYFVGNDVSLLQLVAQVHGFPLRLIDAGERLSVIGTLLANGTWTGIPGEIAAGHADLALGGMAAAICESKPLEFTTSYIRQGLVWFTPRPERLPAWYSVFSGAPTHLIVAMTAINVVISLIIWISSASRGVRRYRGFHDSCFAMFSAIFSVPVKEPSLLSARVAFLSWILFSMVMEASLSSVITSHLSHPSYGRAITNDEELVQSGLRGASLPDIAEIYPTFQKPGTINITEICDSLDDCARRVAYKRDVAVLAPDLPFRYIGRTTFHDESGTPLFTPLKDRLISSPTAMLLAKGNPLAPLISDTILRIVEAGLLQYDSLPSAGGTVADADSNNDKQMFSFYFTIYLTTMMTWVVVLLGEITFNKWYHRRKGRVASRHRLKRIKNAPVHGIYDRGRVLIGGGFNTPITLTL